MTNLIPTMKPSHYPEKPLARPGCTWVPGSMLVSVCAEECWRQVPMQRCGICKTEQHLRVCLECMEVTGELAKKKQCSVCSGDLAKGRWVACSDTCLVKRFANRSSAKRSVKRLLKKAAAGKTCAICQKPVPLTRHTKSETCSDRCYVRLNYKRKRARLLQQDQKASLRGQE